MATSVNKVFNEEKILCLANFSSSGFFYCVRFNGRVLSIFWPFFRPFPVPSDIPQRELLPSFLQRQSSGPSLNSYPPNKNGFSNIGKAYFLSLKLPPSRHKINIAKHKSFFWSLVIRASRETNLLESIILTPSQKKKNWVPSRPTTDSCVVICQVFWAHYK